MTARTSIALLCPLLLAACSPSPPETADSATTDSIARTSVARFTIDSEALGDQVEVLVAVPESGGELERRYPVVYLLDGRWHIRHASAGAEVLAEAGLAPEVVVVGVTTGNRGRHFSPDDQGEVFLDLLEEEIIPLVEERSPVVSHRTLVGHSLGGLLVMHTLVSRPHLFDAHVAISPSLAAGPRSADPGTPPPLLARLERRLAEAPGFDEFLFVCRGEHESDVMVSDLELLLDLLDEHSPPGLQWRYELLADETHATCVVAGVFRGLQAVHAGWSMQPILEAGTVDELVAHYQSLGEQYGCEMPIPESEILNLGYRRLAENRFDDAVAAFAHSVAAYPGSATSRDSMAYALEAVGDVEGAIIECRQSLALAGDDTRPGIARHLANLEARHAVDALRHE